MKARVTYRHNGQPHEEILNVNQTSTALSQLFILKPFLRKGTFRLLSIIGGTSFPPNPYLPR